MLVALDLRPQHPLACPAWLPCCRALQEVADLVASCLRENPAERPTAQQVLQQLSRLVERSAGGRGSSGRADSTKQHPQEGSASSSITTTSSENKSATVI